MSRTMDDIGIGAVDNDDLLLFVEDWFDKKNFDIMQRSEGYLKVERRREIGWICFEFWIVDSETELLLHMEGYVKGATVYEGQEWKFEHTGFDIVGKWPRNKGKEYHNELKKNLKAFLSGQQVQKGYEDPLLHARMEEEISQDEVLWRKNMIFMYSLYGLIVSLAIWIGSFAVMAMLHIMSSICFAMIAGMIALPCIMLMVNNPHKVGFLNDSIVIQFIRKRNTIYWDLIEGEGGYPKLKFGVTRRKKRKLLLYLKDGTTTEWPLISPRITYEFRSRFVKRRSM